MSQPTTPPTASIPPLPSLDPNPLNDVEPVALAGGEGES